MPNKRPATFTLHTRMGAAMTDHGGWDTPARFTSPQEEAATVTRSVGLADVSWMARLDLKGPGVNAMPALEGHARSWLLGPAHVLITCNPDASGTVAMHVSSSNGVWMTDVTSVYAQFLLAGPRSRDVLRKLTSLNVSERALPDLDCGQAAVSHVRSIVLRQDIGGVAAFHLLTGREYAESMWEAVEHAGREFSLSPFGLEALGKLGS
jgi:glycine cleavage system aminomethyltransferase T